MKRDINAEWILPYSTEKVWSMLTTKELVKQWMPAVSDFKPAVGFQFEQQQKARGDWDGMIYHEIVELVPGKQLSFTFKSGPRKGVITLDTLVTFTVLPDKNGTKLQLAHTGFTGMRNCMTSFILELGWKKQIAKRFVSILSEEK